MSTGGIFTAILAGIVIGALGRLIIPGRQAIGWILTFAVGLVGAVVGGFLAEGRTSVLVGLIWSSGSSRRPPGSPGLPHPAVGTSEPPPVATESVSGAPSAVGEGDAGPLCTSATTQGTEPPVESSERSERTTASCGEVRTCLAPAVLGRLCGGGELLVGEGSRGSLSGRRFRVPCGLAELVAVLGRHRQRTGSSIVGSRRHRFQPMVASTQRCYVVRWRWCRPRRGDDVAASAFRLICAPGNTQLWSRAEMFADGGRGPRIPRRGCAR